MAYRYLIHNKDKLNTLQVGTGSKNREDPYKDPTSKTINNNESLSHSGIPGMKWYRRRYQYYDGTLTPEGKERYGRLNKTARDKQIKYDAKAERKADLKAYREAKREYAKALKEEKRALKGNKIKKGLIKTAVVIGLGAIGWKLLKNKKTIRTSINGTLKNIGKQSLKAGGEALSEAGKAGVVAGLGAVGTITIRKLTEKYEEKEYYDQKTKDRNKIILESSKAAVNSLTHPTFSNNKKNNKSSDNSKAYDAAKNLGKPSNDNLDRASKRYNDLFRGLGDTERSVVKTLANQGYDIDQLERYANSVRQGV